MPRLFEGTQDNDPITTNRIAFGRAGVQYLNMTLANLLTWLNANLTYPTVSSDQETIEIGDWDMDITAGISVSYTPPAGKIVVGAQAYIMIGTSGPLNGQFDPLISGSATLAEVEGDLAYVSPPTDRFDLDRRTGGKFDASAYSGTGFNRGYIVVFLKDE